MTKVLTMSTQQHGFTLIEMVIAVIVITVAMSAMITMGVDVRRTSQLSQTTQQVMRLDRAIREAYRADPNYVGITVAELEIRGAIPVDMRLQVGTAMTARTALNTEIVVVASNYIGGGATAAGGSSYSIQASHLRQSECVQLTRELAPLFLRVQVNGVTNLTNNRGEAPAAATVATACSLVVGNYVRLINN